jgi:hypothetical protein
LLDEAEKAGFVPLSPDQNFVFQQNLVGRNIAVVVLSTNTWPLIRAQPQIVRRAVANATRKLHRRRHGRRGSARHPTSNAESLAFSDQPPRARGSPTVAPTRRDFRGTRRPASAVSSA